jgi:hypothetical protein
MNGKVRVSLFLSALALSSCGAEPPPVVAPEPPPAPAVDPLPAPTATEILDLAIQAAGGLERLRAASSWTSTTKGVYMGMPYESKNVYKSGVVRMDVAMSGEPMSMVMAGDPCWMKTGPVVTPCSAEDRAANRKMSAMGEAMRLAPLVEPGWDVTAQRADVDGRPADVFTVRNAAVGAEGMLVFDAETHVMTKATYAMTMHGREAEVLVVPSGYREMCGVQMPAKMVSTFGGAPYVEEEIVDLRCEPIDDAVFAQPAQVADGTVVEREAPAAAVGCVVMKGPYDGFGAAFGKLTEMLAGKGLAPSGPALAVYRRGPADTKVPGDYVTDVCLPLAIPAPAAEETTGELVVKALPAVKVLSVYGVGPCAQRSPDLAKIAGKEAGKRKLKPAGKTRQIFHSDMATTPPAQQVSELQLPVK